MIWATVCWRYLKSLQVKLPKVSKSTTSMKCSLPVPDHRLLCQPLWEYPSWINAQDEHVLASFGKARNTLQIQTGTGASWLNCFLTAHQSNPLTNLFYRTSTVQGFKKPHMSLYIVLQLCMAGVLLCPEMHIFTVAGCCKEFFELGRKMAKRGKETSV